ncbi:MAG: hypothetical protein ACI86H_001242 [bacterium]|jgi:hypothetical protein
MNLIFYFQKLDSIFLVIDSVDPCTRWNHIKKEVKKSKFVKSTSVIASIKDNLY